MVIKKSGVILSNKARESLRKHITYLKEEVSKETAEYVRKNILEQCK